MRTLAGFVVDSHDLVVFVEDDAWNTGFAVARRKGGGGVIVHQSVERRALLPARRRHEEGDQKKSEKLHNPAPAQEVVQDREREIEEEAEENNNKHRSIIHLEVVRKANLDSISSALRFHPSNLRSPLFRFA